MSKFAKSLFVLVSLAPILGAYAVNDLAQGKGVYYAALWLAIAALLVLICWLLLIFARRHLAIEELRVKSLCSTDKEVLAYLVAYLLPIISKEPLDLTKNPATAIFVLLVLFVAVYHSNAFHFNPLLGLLGYHFYEVKSDDGMTFMLVTKRVIRKQEFVSRVAELTSYVYLETQE